MTGVKAEEAERFYEEDEDPDEVFATFDAAVKGRTAPPGDEPMASENSPRDSRHATTRGETHRVAAHEGALGNAAASRH
jgi:hypothetical protein